MLRLKWAWASSCWNNIVCRKYAEICFSFKSCLNTFCRHIKYLLPVRRKSNRLPGKVRWIEPPQCRPKINRKQSLRFKTSCYMWLFHFQEMGFSLIDKQHNCRETGICSTLLKIWLYKSNMRRIITRLKLVNTLQVIQMYFIVSENHPDSGTGNPDSVR